MVSYYDLTAKEWLGGLYEEQKWCVLIYVKKILWPKMSITKLSESMNTFFDTCIYLRTTWKQFVEQYENALRDKIEKENRVEYESFNSTIPRVYDYNTWKQLQLSYTNVQFREVQRS